MFRNRPAIFAERDYQALIGFNRDVRLHPDPLRQQILGVSRGLAAPGIERPIEAVSVGRQVHALDGFKIYEVIRLLRPFQRQF